jgi:cytochrome c oxidase subunit 1
MGVAAIFSMFAGLTYWFPKMFGRMMNETLSKAHFWLTFLGVYAVFGPMHYLGMIGAPRRYAEITGVDYLAARGAGELHHFITIAVMVLVTAQLIFLVNLVWSFFAGRKPESDNPWEATTLEWSVPTPPPHDNFAGRLPIIQRGPYEYSVPGAARDYIPQAD